MILKDIARQIEESAMEIGDLKTQREYLIDKVVLGQRLALARCRFSFSYCQEKAWIRFEANCNASMSGGAIAEIAGNITLIGNVKARMVELEEENKDIAE